MNDDLTASERIITVAPRLGPMHDDSERLYADPAEMDDYLAVLDASGSLRCAHEVPRHLDCADCETEASR